MAIPSPAAASTRGPTFLPSLLFFVIGWAAFVAFCVLAWLFPGWLLAEGVDAPVRPLAGFLAVGALASMLFGVGYHVLPMLSGLPLWSRRLPWIHLTLHAVGLSLLAMSAAGVDGIGLVPGAAAVIAGMALFGLNQQLTTGRLSLWVPSTITFTLAVFWLGVTAVLVALIHTGSVAAFARAEPAALMALVINLGVVGFLLMALLGLALQLFPMFGISSARAGILAWLGCVLLSVGLHLLAMGELAALTALRAPAIWAISAGVGAYLLELMRLAFTARRAPGWALGIPAAGLLLLIPVLWVVWVSLLAPDTVALAPKDGVRVTFLLMLLGPVAVTMLGYSLRLVPLLAWQIRYADRVGFEPVPAAEALLFRAVLPPFALALALGWGYLAAGLWLNEKTGITFAAASYLVAVFLWLVALAPALSAGLRRGRPSATPVSRELRWGNSTVSS
jgi:hypothetical protein